LTLIMAGDLFSDLLCLLVSVLFIVEVAPVHVFDVYRMIQYEKVATNEMYGSKRTSFSLTVTDYKQPDLARKAVLIPLVELDLQTLDRLVSTSGGIVVLLPEEGSLKNVSAEVLSEWIKVEQRLLHIDALDIPIYFVEHNKYLEKLSQSLTYGSRHLSGELVSGESPWIWDSLDTYVFVVRDESDAAPLPDQPLVNIQGWLAGASGTRNKETLSLPTFAIVAHYDTFGVAPGLATGVDSNGSGVVALLELARLFSKLYSSYRTQARFNILFVLTAGGRQNYFGTKKWLENVDPHLLRSIDFALCLDSIADGSDLYFHTSRPPKDPKIRQIFDDFSDTFSEMERPFSIVHKKINISNPIISWEHEQFSRKRIVAATVSHFGEPPATLFSRGSILDNLEKSNISLLSQNVALIAEALSKYIYGLHGNHGKVFQDSLAVNEQLMHAWLENLNDIPRVANYFGPDHPLIKDLEKNLAQYTTDVSQQTVIMEENPFIFYGPCKSEMSVQLVKPVLFDILLSLVLFVYLGLIYVVIKGPRESLRQVIGIFIDPNKKKSH